MYCSSCGHRVSESQRYCPACGKDQLAGRAELFQRTVSAKHGKAIVVEPSSKKKKPGDVNRASNAVLAVLLTAILVGLVVLGTLLLCNSIDKTPAKSSQMQIQGEAITV